MMSITLAAAVVALTISSIESAFFIQMKIRPNHYETALQPKKVVGKLELPNKGNRKEVNCVSYLLDQPGASDNKVSKNWETDSKTPVEIQQRSDRSTLGKDEGKLQLGPVLSQSAIYTAIDDILRKHSPQEFIPVWDDKILSDAIANFGRSIGILGETTQEHGSKIQYRPGSVLAQGLNDNDVMIRLATPNDDYNIANLRLSVFSDVLPEMHHQFCFRSCQAIAARRQRGAVCVVATAMPNDKSSHDGCQSQMILGTAECSFHEFAGTQLGECRASDSILYVTEVAVNPSARRQGIGTKLLSAINIFARNKGIESLYLHVDVKNHGALKMYHKSGYSEVDNNYSMYYDFTKSLNLHPGATKGRDHVLLCSNLTTKLTWLEGKRRRRPELVGSLGFEIPAQASV